jgi:hypothetical protein
MATKVKSRPRPKKGKAPPVKRPSATAKAKPKATNIATATEAEPLPEGWHTPPVTKEECLERIRTLGQRVVNCVRFMNGIDTVRGTSEESRQRALIAFYERLLIFERELGRIQEELQLG